MSNLNICIAFVAGQWSSFQTVEGLLAAIRNAGDNVVPGGDAGLDDKECAVLQRAILTQGETVTLDIERMGAEASGFANLKIYDHEGLIVDADTLRERGVDLAACAEVIMVENQWIPVAFIRENMDQNVLAQLDGLYWPGPLMQTQVYKMLHRAMKGETISFLALKQAADQAKLAEEAGEPEPVEEPQEPAE
ncbi:hypothetical protein ACNFBR_27290 [Pseudomonas sp. NY11955]|uniref:hypothetical protein n=1 Tax=Pseudomonas sp. NY11955 TaxID=3400363 RepID=UPI003A88D2F2